MGEKSGRFESPEAFEDQDRFTASWNGGANPVKDIFLRIKAVLLERPGTRLDFHGRPGVSYSLRASRVTGASIRLFALVDVVDDDPENRWLSVCFYADAVTDPEGRGNLIPGGILGQDGQCFDVFGADASLLRYLELRISEAYRHAGDVLSSNGEREK
jgi:hypothetical protein